MKRFFVFTKAVLLLTVGILSFLVCAPSCALAQGGGTNPTLQLKTGTSEKVFSIDPSGNLFVKGKILQNFSPANITSQTHNWSLYNAGLRKFMVQIDDQRFSNPLGHFYLAGRINTNSTATASGGALLQLSRSAAPTAAFTKSGDLNLTGRAYEYVGNIDSFRPEAGAVQFQFARYETENTTGACAVVNVVRTGERTGTISVQYRTLDGTALRLRDYQPVAGTLTFAQNVTVTSLTVPVVYNRASVTTKALTLELFNPAGGCRLGQVGRVEVRIQPLPPAPQSVAPAPSGGGTPGFSELTQFLYQSTAYQPLIQTGVTSGTIQPDRAAVIRGTVYQANGDTSAPLPGVTLTIQGHPEYGSTRSRIDGGFDLAVNGGAELVLNYEKAGYLKSQRRVLAQPNTYAMAPGVAMIRPSAETYFVDLLNNRTRYASVRLRPVLDGDGTRQGVVLFQPATTARMLFPLRTDGMSSPTIPVETFNFSVNEFTLGGTGPAAMPAELDPQVAYTYCAEFSVLEAEAAGARMVLFDKPAIFYLNNFIGFPPGMAIPSGSFFRDSIDMAGAGAGEPSGSRWNAEQNGRVIKILRIDQGTTCPLAVVDVMGSGAAATPEELAQLGIATGELQELAAQYGAGTELWRVPVQHFTYPHDFNWPMAKLHARNERDMGAWPPYLPSDRTNDDPGRPFNWLLSFGKINNLSQVMHESIAIPGTPFTLNYASERVNSFKSGRELIVPLLGDNPPELPTSITCQLAVGGRLFEKKFSWPNVQPGLTTSFTFDGLDAYGHKLEGYQEAQVRIGYQFPVVYAESRESFDRLTAAHPDVFGLFNAPHPNTSFSSGQTSGLFVTSSAYRMYIDPVTQLRYILVRAGGEVNWRKHTVMIPPYNYSPYDWYSGAKAIGHWTLNVHHAYDKMRGVVHKGDGGSYKVTNRYQLSKNLGDIRLAAENQKTTPFPKSYGPGLLGMDIGPDGALYCADGMRIYKVSHPADDRQRKVEVLAGTGAGDYGSSNVTVPTATVSLLNVRDVAVTADGTVYTAQPDQIKKIKGTVTTRVAFGTDGTLYINPTDGAQLYPDNQTQYTGQYDGTPARNLRLGGAITKIAAGLDGSVFVLQGATHLFRVDPTGRCFFIAGNANGRLEDENIHASEARLNAVDIDVGPDGRIYVLEPARIRIIDEQGMINTIAGTSYAYIQYPNGSPASITQVCNGRAIKVGADHSIYYTETGFSTVKTIRVCMIDPAGRAFIVCGGKDRGNYSGDGGPALRAGWGSELKGIAIDRQGNIFGGDYVEKNGVAAGTNLFMAYCPLPVFSTTDTVIPSEDGMSLYKFTAKGVHLETWDARSGEKLLTFNYNSSGQLSGISDSFGNTTQIVRNGAGQATQIIAPTGQTTALGVNPDGYLASVSKPGIGLTRLQYSDDRLTTVTGPRGDAYHFSYDGSGLLTRATDPLGGGLTLERSGTEQATAFVVKTVTAAGLRTSTTLTKANDGTVVHAWTAFDQSQTTVTERSDASNSTVYANGTQLDTWLSPDPRCWMTAPYVSLAYHHAAGMISFTSHTRTVTLPDRFQPFNYTQLDRFNADGNIATVSTAIVNGTERQLEATSPLGIRIRKRIDRYSRLLCVEPPAGYYPTQYSYYESPASARGKLQSARIGSGADERRTTLAYNAQGLPETLTDPLGRTLTLAYDAADCLTTQTLPGGRKVLYEHDASGNLTALAPPGRPAYRFLYDLRNQPTSASLPADGALSPAITYRYDIDRRLAAITLPSGKGLRLHYDAAGRVDCRVTSAAVYRSVFAPRTGQLTQLGDGASTYTLAYSGGLLYSTSLAGPVSGRLTNSYGTRFRVTATHLWDGQSTFTLSRGYNADGQLTSAGSMILAYSPTSGLLTTTTLSDGGSAIVSSVPERSGFGEPLHTRTTRAGTTLYDASFAYDKLARITARTETLLGTATPRQFFYDDAGRLRAVSDGVTTLTTYSYDANGNRLQRWAAGQAVETAGYDDHDRLLGYGPASYTYDADGRLATRTVGAARTVYGYDGIGALRQVDLPDGRCLEYLISPDGKRLARRVNGGTWTRRFLYESGQVPTAELDDQGRLKTRFVYGKRRHAPLYLITYAGGAQTGVYRLICDQTGSVRLVVNTANGTVAQRLDYDEFGRLLADSNPGFQPFGFAGGLWDADTGLVHLGAREYDPQTGRFITPDPAGFRGGLNLYGYVMNDPVNLIDPSGLGPDQVDFTRDWSLRTCLVCGSNGGRWARLHDDGAAGRVKDWVPPPIDLSPAEGAEDDDTWDDPMNNTPGPLVPAWAQDDADLPPNPLFP